ncbi:MAG: hypothetical protein IJW23_03055, partial [Lentisphaeria bacterium]|nr:hypothetical protein [Lentisphaeria bacterium]
WGVFGGYSSSFAEATEDKLGSHAQPTIFSSSTILFQPNFAGLLKLPHNKKTAANMILQQSLERTFFVVLIRENGTIQ